MNSKWQPLLGREIFSKLHIRNKDLIRVRKGPPSGREEGGGVKNGDFSICPNFQIIGGRFSLFSSASPCWAAFCSTIVYYTLRVLGFVGGFL